MPPSSDDRVLYPLDCRWMELAALPVMADRKRLWTALKDLRPERPMVLFEVWTLGSDFVSEDELRCQDPFLRDVELNMRRAIRQVEELGDDFVIEPHYRVYWDITCQQPDFGVGLTETHADDEHGGQVAYAYNHPIRTPQDTDRLLPRTWTVDRDHTYARKARLEEAFGGVLPVDLHGTGGLHAGLTGDLFRLIGNDNLLMWPYDAPDALHKVMAYLRDDRLAFFRWLEAENLLGLNNDVELVGSGSPGYTTALPQPGSSAPVRLRDLWVWVESQETTMISPAMFGRFFLPYMAEVAALFGFVYYGCCEPVHDRWERIEKAIPQVRAVSISPWCDMAQMGEKLSGERVFSRKPKPWPISGDTPDFAVLEEDLDATLSAARNCPLEIIYRDVYRINADRTRLRRWVELVRSRIGGSFL